MNRRQDFGNLSSTKQRQAQGESRLRQTQRNPGVQRTGLRSRPAAYEAAGQRP